MTAETILGDYKGFRARKCPDSDNYFNAFFVCEDGEERCVGQSTDLRSTAEGFLRRPLPTWMTKKPPAWSRHSDQKHIASTCAHGVSLSGVCDPCVESYGSARVL